MLFIVVVAAFHIMFINVFVDDHGKDRNNYEVFRFNIQEARMPLFGDGGWC